MSNTNTGGPAFPVPDIDGSAVCDGMTLRDYFAAKAMPVVMQELWNQAEMRGAPHEKPITHTAAKFSYEMAGAMLKAREQ